MRALWTMHRTVMLCFLAAIHSSGPIALGNGLGGDAVDVSEKLQAYLEAAHEVQQFGGAVLVAQGDRVILRQGYGYANHELKVSNDPNTRFRIASISKYFTAVMVLALEEQGKLHLSDPIGNYIPDLPYAWREVSIQQLLSHTSGIPNYTDTAEFKLRLGQPASTETIIGLVKDQPLKPTGEDGAYSNTGYVLLGMLVEATAKRSYDDILQQLVCTPAGMTDTGCDHRRSLIANRASGYVRTGPVIQNAAYIDMGWAFAAGQVYSTVNDLWLLHRAAVGGKILSDAGWLRIHTAKSGFGCDIRQFRGQKAVRNYGRIQGFSSYVLNLPEQKVFVATLSNCEDESLEPLVEDLAAIVLGQPYATPKATRHVTKSLSADKLDRFIGRFQTGPRTTTQVFRDNADLKIELADRPAVKLIPVSESTFLIEATETEVSFPTDAAGNIESIRIHTKDGTLEGDRLNP